MTDNVRLFDGLGRQLLSSDQPPVTTDRGLLVRPILAGTTQAVSGAVTVSGELTVMDADRLELIDHTLREIKTLLEVALS